MRILIADDDLTTRLMLRGMMSTWGYDVELVSDGTAAWDVLTGGNMPDIAILDWMMPGKNGLQICSGLKELGKASNIYIILLSAKNTTENVVTGLDAGADDYMVKPCDPDELHSRIRAGERIMRYEETLRAQSATIENYASEMKTIAEGQAKQLVHADRMATLGTLSAGVAHEINNPTSFISGNIRMIEKFWDTVLPSLNEVSHNDGAKKEKLDFVVDEFPKTVAGMHKGVTRIKNIVDGLKSYARQGGSERGPCNLCDCVSSALQLCTNTLKYHVTVEQELPDDIPEINANAQQIEQVLVNLLTNAADATRSQSKGHVCITVARTATGVSICIEDNGPGIPPDVLNNIWNPFFTTKAPGKGTGLGLSITQGIIEDHDGTIEAENKKSGGARFIIALPKGLGE